MSDILASMGPWLQEKGLRILILVAVVFIITRFSNAAVARVIRRLVVPTRYMSKEAEEKRENTLIRICNTTIGTVVWVAIALIVLSELGVAIAPLIAAAGIAGLAFGFGAQYLIRDLITGLFLLLENQYRIGDDITVNGVSGVVEDITLRMTTLRNQDGTVYHVPHGTITLVSNRSKEHPTQKSAL